MNATRVESPRQVISAEQIQKRVKELARQISDDYRGQTIQMLAVLENVATPPCSMPLAVVAVVVPKSPPPDGPVLESAGIVAEAAEARSDPRNALRTSTRGRPTSTTSSAACG